MIAGLKATPGPWGVEQNKWQEFVLYRASDQTTVALIDDSEAYYDFDTYEANARLIAAAPELYEALQTLFESYKRLADSGDAGFWSLEDMDEGKQALAALAKARGDA